MDEEKINQILRNQKSLMSFLDYGGDILREALIRRINETEKLLNPEQNKSAVEKQQERTHEALSEEGIKCPNGCNPIKLFEIGNNQFECKQCNEIFTKSEEVEE